MTDAPDPDETVSVCMGNAYVNDDPNGLGLMIWSGPNGKVAWRPFKQEDFKFICYVGEMNVSGTSREFEVCDDRKDIEGDYVSMHEMKIYSPEKLDELRGMRIAYQAKDVAKH